MKSSTARYTYVSAAVLLILGAWGLRLYHLGVLSLWIDEGFSWEVARQGPGAIFALLAAEDRHPPLHYLLLWLTMRVAGQTEFALRFLSAGVGLLAIPLVYRLGRDLGQPIAGAIASALLAVNPFHVWYSQEARMYALLTTLGLASLWFWLRIVEGAAAEAGPDALRRRPLAVAGYVGTTTAALYTHYYAVFFLLVEVAVAAILLGRSVPAFPAIGRRAVPNVVTDVPEGGRWARLNPVGLLVLPPLLFTPWLPAMAQQYRRAGPGYQPDLSLVGVLGQVTTNYIVGDWTTYGGIFVVVVVVVALLGVLPPWGKTLDRPENGRGVPSSCSGPILLVAAFAAPLAAYLITVLTGIDLRATGRMYYLPGVPPFLLLVGRGLVWIGGAAARLVECRPHPLPPLQGRLDEG